MLSKDTKTSLRSSPLLSLTSIVLAASVLVSPALSQDLPAGWDSGISLQVPQTEPSTTPDNTTVVPRTGDTAIPKNQQDPTKNTQTPKAQALGSVQLEALLSDGGQKIKTGIVWRIYQHSEKRGQPRLIETQKKATPIVKLKPGKYIVNAAFGRAYMNKTIYVKPGTNSSEKFVLNAGGLKLIALVEGKPAPKNSVRYDVLDGEPDQSGERKTVIANTKPGLIIRLNAGIYRIISHYGDANAKVNADIQVEAGKLTVATVSHAAAKVTFKLVDRPGGEAHPGIQWSISTPDGKIVKKSVGALPTHILAPGTYTVTAISKTDTYQAEFAIEDGQMASVEVVMN